MADGDMPQQWPEVRTSRPQTNPRLQMAGAREARRDGKSLREHFVQATGRHPRVEARSGLAGRPGHDPRVVEREQIVPATGGQDNGPAAGVGRFHPQVHDLTALGGHPNGYSGQSDQGCCPRSGRGHHRVSAEDLAVDLDAGELACANCELCPARGDDRTFRERGPDQSRSQAPAVDSRSPADVDSR